MALIRIHEKPNAVPVNASVFILSTKVNGVWYDQKVTWEQLKGLIGALDNLENYYKKSETYTKTEVNQLIAQIPSFTVEIVQELPTEDISTTTLYLVPKTTAGTLDYYDEFINLDGTTSGWEYVGKTEVDLSNYYTKAETEAYVKGDGADYIAGTKTFSSLTTTAKNILGAINEAAGAASGAQADATQALADASAAQGTANSASSAASAAQGTADSALTAAGNAAGAAAAAQGTANNAMTTAQSMAVSVTNTLTPGDTTKKVADVTQNNTTVPIYGDDAEKVVVALTDTKTTAAGNPVTLTTEQAGGAKSALVTFAPKQSGTGDPSPSNIRPISGFDGLNLTRTGKNLIDVAGRTITSQTTIAQGISLKAGTYTVSIQAKNNANIIGYFRITSGGATAISQITIPPEADTRLSSTFTIEEDGTYNIICNGQSAGYNYTVSDIMLEKGTTATAYEPYQGETHTATFDETVYWGYLDFVSGKLTIIGVCEEFDGSTDENWNITRTGTENYWYQIDTTNTTLTYNDNDLISNIYVKASVGANNTNQGVYLSGKQVRIRYGTEQTLEDWKCLLNNQPLQLCFKLATPTEISLTPADVNLLKGSNTVWTDGDTVQVKYSELPNGNLGAVIDYIQKLEARVKALES